MDHTQRDWKQMLLAVLAAYNNMLIYVKMNIVWKLLIRP